VLVELWGGFPCIGLPRGAGDWTRVGRVGIRRCSREIGQSWSWSEEMLFALSRGDRKRPPCVLSGFVDAEVWKSIIFGLAVCYGRWRARNVGGLT